MSGFGIEYWQENYSEPSTMDCIGNAKQHVEYMQAVFALEHIDISSIIDLGFGYGYLFQKAMKAFIPFKACGVEPSTYAFDKARARKLKPVESTNLKLHNESIDQWCARSDSNKNQYDLGICTSVFQYLTNEQLDFIIPVLSRRIKYLYLTVPTDKELEKQVTDLNFYDRFALRRPRSYYHKKMKGHFVNVGNKIWESQFYFDEETTFFSDLVYRGGE